MSVLGRRAWLWVGLWACSAFAEEPEAQAKVVSVEDCVQLALRDSGKVAEAGAKVNEWAGRLMEVQSVYYPKLTGLTYLAPIFKVTGDALSYDVKRDLTQWGPYFALKAVLAQPLYTFGRQEAGERAARERLEVERAQLESTKNLVALEVRKLYFLTLYARSMVPVLTSAGRILEEAEQSAKEMYEKGKGGVTNADLMKLRYGNAQLRQFLIQAETGAGLALSALKQTMALPDNAALALADEVLPKAPEGELPSLASLIAEAWKSRPESRQLHHGEKAAMSFEQAERLSSMPLAFVAAQLDLNWTPMWPNLPNPFHWDRFNDIMPAVAVGFQFDVDIAKSSAKARTAHAMVEQVEALKRFAQTGIPMQVRKAHQDAVTARRMLEVAQESSTAGRKWMLFAGSAYVAGTGEARDLLDGLVAYLTAKQGFYSNLQAFHVALAELAYATGHTSPQEFGFPANPGN